MSQIVYCPCGKPLHYNDPAKRQMIEQQIDLLGADVPVRYGTRTWYIPRHYAALHQIAASDLPKLKFPEMENNDILLPFLYDNGVARVSLTAPNYDDQIFTHHDSTDGRIRHFHINKLAQSIARADKRVELAEFPIEQKQIDFILSNRGVDSVHVTERMTNEFAEKPGIICVFPDTSQLIVDGHHRYIKRDLMGRKFMKFWVVPETIWRKCLVRVPAQFESL